MPRSIKLQVPFSVSATCHYAAQIAGCSVSEAYGVILFTSLSRMTQEEAATWVQKGLPLYQAALAHDSLALRRKEN